MDNVRKDELVKELDFNIAYLADKYGLDSILILASSSGEDGTTSFESTRGNAYANSELARKFSIEADEDYKYNGENDEY